jgi:hypothetical protein
MMILENSMRPPQIDAVANELLYLIGRYMNSMMGRVEILHSESMRIKCDDSDDSSSVCRLKVRII